MKTDMNITFTGIKNAAGVVYPGEGQNLTRRLIVQLTNEGTKDLDEFSSILKEYPDKLNKNFLRIDSSKVEDTFGNIHREFYLNEKPVEISNQNMNIFEKLLPFLTKISESEKPFPHKLQYYSSGDCIVNLYKNPLPSNFKKENKDYDFIEDAHSFDVLKETARRIRNAIANNLEKFFYS